MRTHYLIFKIHDVQLKVVRHIMGWFHLSLDRPSVHARTTHENTVFSPFLNVAFWILMSWSLKLTFLEVIDSVTTVLKKFISYMLPSYFLYSNALSHRISPIRTLWCALIFFFTWAYKTYCCFRRWHQSSTFSGFGSFITG